MRPVNLKLTTIHFPVMAIVSILHRISGVILFILFPFMLFLLQKSLQNTEAFVALKISLDLWYMKCLLWSFCVAGIYHLAAGVRHILMDCGYMEQLDQAQHSAWVMISIVIICSIFLGIWLC